MTTYQLSKPNFWQRFRNRPDRNTSISNQTVMWPMLSNRSTTLDIVVPAKNEAMTLQENVRRLHEYVNQQFPFAVTITIADSGSTDETLMVARELEASLHHVRVVHLSQSGRGRALKEAWSTSTASILAYVDEDLSTDLSHLSEIIEPLIAGQAPLATGSRLARGAQVKRRAYREVISRSYVRIVKHLLGLQITDAQCGFKAIRADAARKILPLVKDDAWFFDTELIARAQREGWPVAEVPVKWIEDTDSRVKVVRTARDDLRGISRLRSEVGQRSLAELFVVTGLLIGTAIFYIANLSINGDANSFYAASVQAATTSWKAFFYASLDGASFVTVDKPPVAIWAMALSARAFGFSSFSMLLPNALAGVATVALVYGAVRRFFSWRSAALAGVVMALTPVAALMFRFNNPDAILTFFLTLSAYALIRALESDRMRWLMIAGIATGFAFNTKMLQGLIVLPALAVVYIIAAKPKFLGRVWRLLVAGIVTAISALWWPTVVWLTPAASRPYIDNSTNNNIWNLIFGYNGLSRILGRTGTGAMRQAAGVVPPGTAAADHATTALNFAGRMGGGFGAGRTGFGESTGILRMFNSDFGGNIAWFIPVAFVGLLIALWVHRRQPRTSLKRAAFMLWGGWMILHVVVFSFASGTIHPYYPVVIAPGIAALVGMSAPYLWRAYRSSRGFTAWLLPFVIFMTGAIALVFLSRSSVWLTELGWGVAGITTGVAGIMSWHLIDPLSRRLARAAAVAGLIATLAGPAAYSASTVLIAHTGSIPTAGPTSTAMAGSNNETSKADSKLVSYLLAHRDGATWIVAVSSANESAPIQLSANAPVMALGGFSGTDNVLTLTQFKALVAAGKIKYYAVSSGGRGGFTGFGGSNTSIRTDGVGRMGGFGRSSSTNSAIEAWATSHGTKVDYGGTGTTLYELHL